MSFTSKSLLSIAVVLAAPMVWANPPVLRPLQFSLQAQRQFQEFSGTLQSGPVVAQGGGSGNGPTVAVFGSGLASTTTADNEASARALWSFEVSGPAGVTVPILIDGLYSASSNTTTGVSGGVALGLDRFRMTQVLSFRCQAFGVVAGCDSQHGNRPMAFALHEAAISGQETFISIVVGGSLRGAPMGQFGVFDVSLDPLISIDPTFARASEFTIFVSPGAEGSVTPVPEPQTWALMLAGMAVTGALPRRRKRSRD